MDALERFRQLAEWLGDTDIASLELRGPQTLLRLVRDDVGNVASGDVVSFEASQPRPGTTIVAAACVGIVRYRHPLRDAPLAPVGAHVEAGQALVLLQIGQLLVPVTAPRDGVVCAWLADDGDAIGYGDPLIQLRD